MHPSKYSSLVVCQNYTEINRFMVWLMKPCDFHYCWSAVGARTPGRKCPSFGVVEVVLFRFDKMLNWQKTGFFFLGGGHHKGVMRREPKWLAAALSESVRTQMCYF